MLLLMLVQGFHLSIYTSLLASHTGHAAAPPRLEVLTSHPTPLSSERAFVSPGLPFHPTMAGPAPWPEHRDGVRAVPAAAAQGSAFSMMLWCSSMCQRPQE